MKQITKRSIAVLFIVIFTILTGLVIFTTTRKSAVQALACYNEMVMAQRRQKAGDRTENPFFEYIHGYYCARAFLNTIDPAAWKTVRFSGGTLVIHKDFVAMEVGQAKKANVFLNEDLLEEYLKEYLVQMVKSRERYQRISQSAYSNMRVLVALPSYEDNPQLWLPLKQIGNINSIAPVWLAVNESGVVLSSDQKKTQDHDFITQMIKQAKSLHAPLEEIIRSSARHEGNHGAIESTIIFVLKLKTDNPIYEGIASALSGDNSVRAKTDITAAKLLSDPYPQSVDLRGETAYSGGAKYWTSLYVIKKGNLSEEAAWANILKPALSTAHDMSRSEEIFALSQGERISRFMNLLLERLHISRSRFDKEYEKLNQ